VLVSAGTEALDWKLARLAEGDVSWRTQIVKAGSRYVVAGANLGILDGLTLTVVGR
jgi:hypothetical protein